MSIQPGYKANFETLLAAARNGDLCIMECMDKATGKPVIAVCAVSCTVNDEDGECGNPQPEYSFTPVAKLFDGNPYEELESPGMKAD